MAQMLMVSMQVERSEIEQIRVGTSIRNAGNFAIEYLLLQVVIEGGQGNQVAETPFLFVPSGTDPKPRSHASPHTQR